MVIRDIQLRKAAEARKAREKAEAQGKGKILVVADEGEQDPTKMTEAQIYQKQMDDKAKGADTGLQKSEEQLKREQEDKEREIYGRYWIWEGYFSEKSKDKWLDAAEGLKHIND